MRPTNYNKEDFEGSMVFYESKYRIGKTLLGISNTLGEDRFVCISRELTKIHETFHIGKVCDVRDKMKVSSTKGEFTLVVAPEGYTL